MKNPNSKIYEKKGVYGDLSSEVNSSDRITKVIRMIRDLNIKPTNILDVGCGTGYISNEIKKVLPEAHIFGIDISTNAINIGKRKYKNILFKKVDTEKGFPFSSNFFDLVISGEHIEHVVDTDNYLQEINRVLKNKGSFILTTPNLASWFNRIMLLLGKQPYYLEPCLKKTFPIIEVLGITFPANLNSPPSGHLRLFTLDILKKMFSYYNFSLGRASGYSMLSKYILRQVDDFFCLRTSLAMGLILVSTKKSLHEK